MQPTFVISGERKKWYQVWWLVWTHPTKKGFEEVLNDPEISAAKGFIWIVLASFVMILTSVVGLNILLSKITSDLMSSFVRIYSLPVIVFYPPLSAVLLAITAGVYRLVGKLLGGKGSWENLVYCFAAIIAPTLLLTSLYTLLMYILAPSFLTSETVSAPLAYMVYPLSIAGLIYTIVLYVSAIGAVEGFSTGKAVLTFFIPVVLGYILGAVIWLFLLADMAINHSGMSQTILLFL